MRDKKLTIFLLVMLASIFIFRIIGVKTLKFSLGLDSVYLQIVDIFSKYNELPMQPVFNQKIDISMPIEKWPETYTKKEIGSFYNIFRGNLVLSEIDYEVFPKSEDKSINPLSFMRIYNSDFLYDKTPLGFGWRPFWDVKFYLINDIYVFRSASGEIETYKYIPKENIYLPLKNGWLKYRLEFNAQKNHFIIKSPNGYSFQFEQSVDANQFTLKKIIHGHKKNYNVQWEKNKITAIIESDSERITRFEYDNVKNVIKTIIFPSGYSLFLDYDSNLNLKLIKNDFDSYIKNYEYKLNSNIHLLTGSGNNIINRTYEYTNKKLVKIINTESGNIEIKRDFLLGQCHIVNPNKEAFKFINLGNYQIDIKGPLDFNSKIIFDDKGRIIKVIDSQNLTSQYVWDKFNNLLQIENTKKGIYTYDYDENENLISKTDPLGNKVLYKYENDFLVRKFMPDGDVLRYTYNNGFIESIFYESDKSMEKFKVDKAGNVIEYENKAGNVIIMKYDDDGYIKEKSMSSIGTEKYKWTGGKLQELNLEGLDKVVKPIYSLKYDNVGRIASVQNFKGEKILYDYDSLDRIKKVTFSSGAEEQFFWNECNLLSKYIKPSGEVISITYDLLNRPLNILSNDVLQNQFFYEKESGVDITPYGLNFSKFIDSNKKVIDLAYDEGYKVKKIKYSSGKTQYFEYDLSGALISQTNQNNEKISYFYDKNGFLEYLYDKKNENVLIFKHDNHGNIIKYTDEFSDTYQINYDLQERPVSIFKELNSLLVEWKWNEDSQLIEIKNPFGEQKQFFYNTQNLLVGEKNNNNGVFEYNYFSSENPMYEADADGRKIEYTYYQNHLLKEKKLIQSNIIYNYNYDLTNRLKSYSGVAPVNFTWSDSNELIKLTFDRKNILLLAYSSAGEIIKKTYPGLLVQINKYNDIGQLENISENGLDIIQYEYDREGRLISILYPNQLKTQYEYGNDGKVNTISTVNSKGKIIFNRVYTYDNKNLLVKILTERGHIKRDYDKLGRIVSEDLDDKDNTSYSYSYSNDNKMNSVTVRKVSGEQSYNFVYDSETKNLLRLIKASKAEEKEDKFRINLYGVFNSSSQAGFLEIEKQVVQIVNKKFEVNNVALQKGLNKIPVHYISASGKEINYTYDINYDPSYFQTFKYDATGNILFESEAGLNKVFAYNDEQNIELVKLLLGSKIKNIKFDYYANKQLCFKEATMDDNTESEKTQYLFDEQQNIIGEFSFPEGSYKSLYMFSPSNEIVYRIDRGHKKYFYHLDKDGSVIGITDSGGQVVCAYSYDAFGKVAFIKQNVYNPFLFLGHFYDSDSDFYFHKGYTGRPYNHALKFEKSAVKDLLKQPEKVLKEVLKHYPGNKPESVKPLFIMKSSLPQIKSGDLYSNDELIIPEFFGSK